MSGAPPGAFGGGSHYPPGPAHAQQAQYSSGPRLFGGGPPPSGAYPPPAGGGYGGPPPPGGGGGVKRRYDEDDLEPHGGHDIKRPYGGPDPYGPPPTGGPETVLRLLVSTKRVGSIIGKGGTVVKQIRDETGSRIRVVEGIPQCDERVIVISAPDEGPEVEHNAAQRGLYRVHQLAAEGEEPVPGGGGGGAHGNLTRLLVCHSQAGCIIGKGGVIIKQMREQSGAHIKVLSPEELPACALSNDRVVQIVGDAGSLQSALHLVSKQIRENPPKERPGGPPVTLSQLTHGMMPPGPAQMGAISSGGPRPGGVGGGFGGMSKKMMQVPQSAIGSIIGSGGSNINRIRQETGAKIKVFDEPEPSGERLIEIAGNPDQMAAAEAAILPYATGEPPNAFY